MTWANRTPSTEMSTEFHYAEMLRLLLDEIKGKVDPLVYSDGFYVDCLLSLTGINPVGPATAPIADTNGEGWLFAGVSTDNVAVLSAQINHDNVQGTTTIYPHIHWRKSTNASGNVVWRLEYKIASPGADFGNFVQVGTDQKLPIAATVDNNTAARHLITEFGALTVDVAPSTIIYFKLTRVASDTVNDTYAADAVAMSLDFHRIIDSPGSRTEYVK